MILVYPSLASVQIQVLGKSCRTRLTVTSGVADISGPWGPCSTRVPGSPRSPRGPPRSEPAGAGTPARPGAALWPALPGAPLTPGSPQTLHCDVLFSGNFNKQPWSRSVHSWVTTDSRISCTIQS